MKRIGIFGAGQLGRMLALSGARLGLKCELYAEEDLPCGSEVASYTKGRFNDEAAVNAFASRQDVCTAEFENIPISTLSLAAAVTPLYPPIEGFQTAQDRLKEKELASKLNIPVPNYRAISSLSDLVDYYQELGAKRAILKTRSLGYDGKGQARISSAADLDTAWQGINGSPSLLEEHFPFEREVSIIGVRSTTGETRFYDLVENTHQEGILVRSVVLRNHPLQERATTISESILNELNYVGVLAIELFVKDNKLYLNEIAPRVHNTGHWSIEGARTSQFENHLRAILGLPLGETTTLGEVEMTNIIGSAPPLAELLSQPDTYLHLYGKEERPGRKIGHLTRVINSNRGLSKDR